jgi:DNA mismatch endonuclease (patch repair protein)
MTDSSEKFERSANMRANKSRGTSPEMRVRRALHAEGLRYVLHDKRLPGKPDLVFPSPRLAVFVHGCFWHQHQNCKLSSVPQQRTEYWGPKLARNVERDGEHTKLFEADHWRVKVVWECETRDVVRLTSTTASQISAYRFSADRSGAAGTSRQGLDECDDQSSAHGGD